MAYLYQEIMNVPGLTGTWKERLSQYYKNLTGNTYTGTKDQGLYMLQQIANGNYGTTSNTSTSSGTSSSDSGLTLAEQYTKAITDQAAKIAAIPTFQQTLPFAEAWSGLVPQATAAAESQINPEVMRNYKTNYLDYMNNLISSGGQRLGRGLSGVGSLKASTERDRQSQLQDWLNQYQEGFNTLFYEPSATAWDAARTQGTTPDSSLTNVPTWNDLYSQYNSTYGVGDNTSPLYG